MNKIEIVNKAVHAPTNVDVYIGRGSTLGNPYTSKDLDKSKAIFKVANKEEAINCYEEYLNKQISEGNNNICDELNRIYLMALKSDINLVCYCKPKHCHGDVIKNIINAKLINYYMNYERKNRI